MYVFKWLGRVIRATTYFFYTVLEKKYYNSKAQTKNMSRGNRQTPRLTDGTNAAAAIIPFKVSCLPGGVGS